MHAIVIALHGILTKETDPSWPDRFEDWALLHDEGLHVRKRKYFELPFPRINWFKNRWLARSLAAELLLAAQEDPEWSIWFVAHSNGTCLAWLTVKRLIESGVKVGGMILTGSALEAEVRRNQVLTWCAQGKLGCAISYSSPDDLVTGGDPRVATTWREAVRDFVWGRLMWPYGCLGRTGWLLNGEALTCERVFTRWVRGGHSAYWQAERITQTFEQIYADMVRFAGDGIGQMADGKVQNESTKGMA